MTDMSGVVTSCGSSSRARRAISSRLRPRNVRNRMDSGSFSAMTSATISGTMPPATNSAFQPKIGTSQPATTAGMPLPSDMPMMGMLVSVARRLHQIVDPVGPDRLDDVRTDCLQEHVAFLLFKKNFCCAHGVIR